MLTTALNILTLLEKFFFWDGSSGGVYFLLFVATSFRWGNNSINEATKWFQVKEIVPDINRSVDNFSKMPEQEQQEGRSPLHRFAISMGKVIDGPITWFRGK